MKNTRLFVLILGIVALWPEVARAQDGASQMLALKSGWAIESSAKAGKTGAEISQAGFSTAHWHHATVPTTVVAALVDDKTLPEPYFGKNLRELPGMSYKIGENFSHFPFPADSPYRVSWWYRTEFQAPTEWSEKSVWLNFRAINYRANIWLNGRLIAKAADVAGAFRRYEFEVGRAIHAGKANALAVEVFPPTPHDLAITFVDWNPLPPDKDMGLWGDVFLTTSGPVALRNPQVETKFDLPSLDVAHLTVRATVRNMGANAIEGNLRGAIEGAEFSQRVTLAGNETKEVTFTPQVFPQLNLAHPRVWWPYRMGGQDLYELKMEFDIGKEASDHLAMKFGVDEITSELTAQAGRLFKINGKRLLIRGGGWTPDMMLRQDPARWEDDFRYVRDMGLNSVRLEGKLMGDEFFDLADRYGILVMAGWCCCDHWEKWDEWKGDERAVATHSLRDQALRLRNHPSVFVWLDGSDGPPPPMIERKYLKVLDEVHWPKPVISSAADKRTIVSGITGVKMSGPYDYVPPSYWLEDTQDGGGLGFNTETSAGFAIPPVESLKKMLPPGHLWPVDDFWTYHAAGEQFQTTKIFDHAMDERYGRAKDLADYERKAQAMAYEGERAMFEAYGRNRGKATGVIQWMLNNAWPSIIWHLYDYYLRPAAGYYGTKKACETLHVQYSYDDRSVAVVNDGIEAQTGLKVAGAVYDMDMQEKFKGHATLDSPADSSTKALNIPEMNDISAPYFVKLTLQDSSGRGVSRNFYWLSEKVDHVDPKKTTWYYTPQTTFSDFHGLEQLPPVELRLSSTFESGAEIGTTHVHASNPTSNLAFMVHLKASRASDGEEILPVYWEDNYFELMPGEARDVSATYRMKDLQGAEPKVTVDGWNVTGASE